MRRPMSAIAGRRIVLPPSLALPCSIGLNAHLAKTCICTLNITVHTDTVERTAEELGGY